jgi:hypothetical protein
MWIDYAFIVANAAALNMLGVGILLVCARRVGGLHHWRIGRFGGSFYVARKG